jgi:hypothetical protein
LAASPQAVFDAKGMRHLGSLLLLSLLLLGACAGTEPTAVKAPQEVRVSAPEEPGPQTPRSTFSPVPPWDCVVRSPAGQCFESKEQACAAMGCPTDCSYLYAGTHDGAADVACN